MYCLVYTSKITQTESADRCGFFAVDPSHQYYEMIHKSKPESKLSCKPQEKKIIFSVVQSYLQVHCQNKTDLFFLLQPGHMMFFEDGSLNETFTVYCQFDGFMENGCVLGQLTGGCD